MSNRWLSKNEYARIRYRAKKMGAEDVCLNYIWHHVSFKHTIVSFVFKPLEYHVTICSGNPFTGHLSIKRVLIKLKKTWM